MRTKKRKTGKEISKEEKLIGVVPAANRLGVSGRTVQMACKRWKLGKRINVGTLDRVVILLTEEEIEYLDRNLQRRAGRPVGEVEVFKGWKK